MVTAKTLSEVSMKVHLERLPENALDCEVIWGSIGLLVLLAARFFPFSRFPKLPCIFHQLTGYPCPSCGMTRSFILMSHLNFSEAAKINPLGSILFVFTLIFVFYAFIVILFHAPRIRIRVTQKWEGICIRIMVVAVFVINWTYLIIFQKAYY